MTTLYAPYKTTQTGIVVTTADSYGTKYCVGGLLTLNNIIPHRDINPSNNRINLDLLKLIFNASTQSIDFYVAVFNRNPAAGTYTDKTAVAFGTDDHLALIDVFKLTSPTNYLDVGTVYTLRNLNYPIPTMGALYGQDSADTTLYVAIISSAALTNQFARSDEVVFELGLTTES